MLYLCYFVLKFKFDIFFFRELCCPEAIWNGTQHRAFVTHITSEIPWPGECSGCGPILVRFCAPAFVISRCVGVYLSVTMKWICQMNGKLGHTTRETCKHNSKKNTTVASGESHQLKTAILIEENEKQSTTTRRVTVFLFWDLNRDRSRLLWWQKKERLYKLIAIKTSWKRRGSNRTALNHPADRNRCAFFSPRLCGSKLINCSESDQLGNLVPCGSSPDLSRNFWQGNELLELLSLYLYPGQLFSFWGSQGYRWQRKKKRAKHSYCWTLKNNCHSRHTCWLTYACVISHYVCVCS